jgi:hypothetical protein
LGFHLLAVELTRLNFQVDADELVAWIWDTRKSASLAKREEKALTLVKKKFKTMAQSTVELKGWRDIFETYDDDGSGELDVAEFLNAVRQVK